MAIAQSYYGYNPPFFGGHQNVLSRQSGDRLIKNDLIQLIMTSVGERVMRPGFGTLLRQYVFENMTDADINSLQRHLSDVVTKYETRVSVVVSIVRDNENSLNISFKGSYTDNPNTMFEAEMNIPINSGAST